MSEGRGSLEARVVELEVRSEYQKENSREMDDVMREFTDRVEKLEREFRELRRLLQGLAESPQPPSS